MKFQKIISTKDNRVKFLIPGNVNIKPANIKLSIVVPAYNEKKNN